MIEMPNITAILSGHNAPQVPACWIDAAVAIVDSRYRGNLFSSFFHP